MDGAFVLIISSAFSLCTVFWTKLEQIDNNNNNDKYNNNRHKCIEKIDSKQTETTWDEYRL